VPRPSTLPSSSTGVGPVAASTSRGVAFFMGR
jgi:hypothetical protein